MSNDASAQRLWEATLGHLQLALPRPSFDTWLRDTVGLSVADNKLLVSVPTTFTAAWLEQRMHGLIEDTVSKVARNSVAVYYQVRGADSLATQAAPGLPPTAAQATAAGEIGPAPQLNPSYTFKNFIVGPSNQLAYAASTAVSDAPGGAYNPLFLYSGVGLGKTHLLHAIGHQVATRGLRAAYVTTEQFTNEYLTAIRERHTDQFRERYRSLDVLLLDDIQFISGKEGTQEAFFHTFNALRDSGQQVVITCDRPPSALPLLEERLRSRLEWGLMADIGAPDLETRTAILQQRALTAPVTVPPEVIQFIAERIPSNIRQLEGCLNRVTALAHFTRRQVTIDLAVNALGAAATHQADGPSPKAAIAAVASYYNIPSSALVSGRRDKTAANARQVAMFILHKVFNLPAEQIGQALGNRDRTTVLYALKQVTKRMATDNQLTDAIQQLSASLSVKPAVSPDP